MTSTHAQVATEDAANAGMASRHTREAGEIADMTLRHILALCVPGAKAADICRTGDSYMLNRLRERFPGLVAADTFPDTSKFSTKKHAGARARVTAADLTPRNDTVWCAIKANSSYLATHVQNLAAMTPLCAFLPVASPPPLPRLHVSHFLAGSLYYTWPFAHHIIPYGHYWH